MVIWMFDDILSSTKEPVLIINDDSSDLSSLNDNMICVDNDIVQKLTNYASEDLNSFKEIASNKESLKMLLECLKRNMQTDSYIENLKRNLSGIGSNDVNNESKAILLFANIETMSREDQISLIPFYYICKDIDVKCLATVNCKEFRSFDDLYNSVEQPLIARMVIYRSSQLMNQKQTGIKK